MSTNRELVEQLERERDRARAAAATWKRAAKRYRALNAEHFADGQRAAVELFAEQCARDVNERCIAELRADLAAARAERDLARREQSAIADERLHEHAEEAGLFASRDERIERLEADLAESWRWVEYARGMLTDADVAGTRACPHAPGGECDRLHFAWAQTTREAEWAHEMTQRLVAEERDLAAARARLAAWEPIVAAAEHLWDTWRRFGYAPDDRRRAAQARLVVHLANLKAAHRVGPAPPQPEEPTTDGVGDLGSAEMAIAIGYLEDDMAEDQPAGPDDELRHAETETGDCAPWCRACAERRRKERGNGIQGRG